MRIWIGLLSLSVDINNTSDIIRRGLTAIGSRQPKVDGHISAMSCGVWRVSESIFDLRRWLSANRPGTVMSIDLAEALQNGSAGDAGDQVRLRRRAHFVLTL